MKRVSRHFRFAAVACFAVFPIALVPVLVSAQDDTNVAVDDPPPNIVVVYIDDLGWADLPAYGNRFHETPTIDALAGEGMLFSAAYASAPVCSPSRAAMQTGQYPARLGLTNFIPGHLRPWEILAEPPNTPMHLPGRLVTVAESLRDAGYRTGYFGKWHLSFRDREQMPDRHGYDDAVVSRHGGHFVQPDTFTVGNPDAEEGDYLADVLTNESIRFIEENKERSFFLFLSHYAVHIPLHADEKLINKYERKPVPDVEGVYNPRYAAMIEHVDDSLRRILDSIDELGLTDSTMIVFTSDNGGLSERFDKADGVVVTTNVPLRNEKGSLYEGGIRVPMIVRWPGVVPPNSRSAVPVSTVDFYPTFLGVAGASLPDQPLDGIDLRPVLSGEENSVDRPIFFHYPHYHHSRPAGAIVQGTSKLIEFYDSGEIELYDLSKDIAESRNLAVERPAEAAALAETLRVWRDDVGAEMPTLNPEFDAERRLEWGLHPLLRPARADR